MQRARHDRRFVLFLHAFDRVMPFASFYPVVNFGILLRAVLVYTNCKLQSCDLKRSDAQVANG